jgi:type I restriction enzyme S subunit
MTGQQLKNSILQMAVQGKLVPQDPNDEPASVLVERIREEKQRLIKEGKIKKEKNPSYIFRGEDNMPYEKIGNNEPVCIADEVPFEIPESWEWVRCSSVGAMIRGSGIKRTETIDAGYPCVRYGELYTTYNISFSETISFIPKDIDEKCKHIENGDILFTLTGENKTDIAKAVFYNGSVKVAIGGDLAYWTAHCMNPLYLVYYMASPFVINRKRNTATGDIIVHISTDKVGTFLLPVPPIKEQNRIVSKIIELEPLFRDYSKRENNLSLLNDTFPEQLKKSILQMAVQGKLVSQNESDEPASVLLERIRAEKESMIKSGKLKKDKNESFIFRRDNSYYEKVGNNEPICIDDEIPFDIPESWEWCRLNNIAILENGDRSKKYPTEIDYVVSGIPFFGAKDMGNEKMDFRNVRYISEQKFSDLGNGKLRDGDFVCLLRGSVGKIARFEKDSLHQTGFICAQMLIIRCITFSIRKYMFYFMKSPYYLSYIEMHTTGTAIRQLPAKDLGNMLVPLPPLSEQERILSKIELVFQHIN